MSKMDMGFLARYLAFLAQVLMTTSHTGVRDYCNMETVNATCADNEVIMLTRARYGRMELGRCVKANYGFLGCSVDVMPYLDTICSGRHQCTYKVPDEVLYDSHPCPGDFTSYLQLSHRCVPVETGNLAHCHSHQLIRVSGSTSGYIASIITENFNLGTVHCPWVIEAEPGQRINITLVNFARTSELLPGVTGGGTRLAERYGGPKQRLDICFELAVVSDAVDKKSVTICGGDARETVVYISKTNVAEITMKNRKMLKSIGMFLLKYQIIGCADPKLPPDVWSRRHGDKLMVQCNATDQTWYLTCTGNKWLGDTGNCSSVSRHPPPQHWTLDGLFRADDIFPYGILIVVAIGVALGVFFGGVLLAIIIIHSRKRFQGACAQQQPCAQELPSDQTYTHRGGESRWSLTDLQAYTETDTMEKDFHRYHDQNFGTFTTPRVTYGVVGGVGMMVEMPPPGSHAPCTTTTTTTACADGGGNPGTPNPGTPNPGTQYPGTPEQVPGAPPGLDLDVIHGTRPPHTYESPFT